VREAVVFPFLQVFEGVFLWNSGYVFLAHFAQNPDIH
jgi:hypothetical protein